MTTKARPWLNRLRSERGMALPMALGMMLALTISVGATIEFSSANARSASLNLKRQDATAIAEGGFNSATSIVAAAPTSAVIANCTTWSPWSAVAGGEVRWCGEYDAIARTWTVKGQGRVPNPTGPSAAPQVDTVEAQFAMVNGVDDAYNFVWVRPSAGGCMLIKNTFVMEAPLYVQGNLCLENEARYAGPRLYVTGTIQTKNTSSVGTAAAPIPEVSVRNNAPTASGCRYDTSAAYALPCTASHRVWTSAFDNDVPVVDKPPVDLPARYAEAAPGVARHSCTSSSLSSVNSKFTSTKMDDNTSRNSSIGTVNLMPSVAYDCTQRAADGSVLGRMQWTGTNPGTLTIEGTIFLDGNVEAGNAKHGVVNGSGTIYANNTITFQSNAWLCGVADCGLSWSPNLDPPHLLFLVAGYSGHPAIEVKSDSRFQGGLYAVGGLKVSNGGYIHGPAIAEQVEAENGADFNPWPWLATLPDGAPSDSSAPTVQLTAGTWRG